MLCSQTKYTDFILPFLPLTNILCEYHGCKNVAYTKFYPALILNAFLKNLNSPGENNDSCFEYVPFLFIYLMSILEKNYIFSEDFNKESIWFYVLICFT